MSGGKKEGDSDSDTTAPLSSPYHSSRVGTPELRVLHELLDELDTSSEPPAPATQPSHHADSSPDHVVVESEHLLNLDHYRAEESRNNQKEKIDQVGPTFTPVLILSFYRNPSLIF